jgi:colanic acid/amylovoran biosynthesis glycosyltransferase
MEAMASGLPVISTRHSGIPEIVKDGVSGVLVGEGDVDALAASMVKLASDRTIRERLAQSARAYVERNHDLPAVTDQLISLYASTASTSSDMRPRDVD